MQVFHWCNCLLIRSGQKCEENQAVKVVISLRLGTPLPVVFAKLLDKRMYMPLVNSVKVCKELTRLKDETPHTSHEL